MQQASQASSSLQGDATFGASRAWKLREALKRARASTKATIIPPPALTPTTQPSSVDSDRQVPITITPLENFRNTCFLNAIIQALRVVCNRLHLIVQREHACPLSRLLVASESPHDDFRQRVRTHPLWKDLRFGRQQDAHEAIRLLLDYDHRMHNACTAQSCLARKLSRQFAVEFHSRLACTAATCAWNS